MTETLARTTERPARQLRWQRARVLALVEETPRARSLILDVPDWPGHLAGQHVDVRLTAEDGYQAQRSYSIASEPERANIALTVERIDDGEVSPYLAGEVRVGDRFELRGPIGGYFTWTADSHEPLQLIAGGSGVVPLMAMLRHRARSNRRGPARLLYSVRTPERVIFRDELATLTSDPELQATQTVTREASPAWSGQRGRIDAPMLRMFGFAPELAPRVYVCGPTLFVEAVANALLSLGHDAARIKTERFGPTGGG